MIIENLSSRQEQKLESQELVGVIGGLPTDTVPLALVGGVISGGRSVYSQLSNNGYVDLNTFLKDTNTGIITGIASSFLTPT